MVKGMGPFLDFAHLYLHRIVPMFGLYVHGYEFMDKL